MKKALHLIIVLLILFGVALGAFQLAQYSWDEVAEYHSPFTGALPGGKEGQPLVEQVVMVVIDGLRLDASREMVNLNRLRGQGVDLVARVGQPSLSYPSWTVISTGAWQEISGVTTNWYEGEVEVDTIFREAQRKGLRTAVVGDDGWLQLFGSWVEHMVALEGVSEEEQRDWEAIYALDDQILQGALEALAEEPDLLLIHFEGPDNLGHGFGGASPEYRGGVQMVDDHLGELLAAIDLESTALIVTADHGQIDAGGHGGWESVVTRVPLVMVGRGIAPGGQGVEVNQTDIAPTVAVLLGTAIPTHNQGEALFEYLDIDPRSEAQREDDLAEQKSRFYTTYITWLRGTAPQEGTISEEMAQSARMSRLSRERVGRLPIALLVALLPVLYIGFYPRKRELLLPFGGALLYFVGYNLLFFGRGNSWSLSAFNSEAQIWAFITQRIVEAALVSALVGLVVGWLGRKRSAYGAALAALNTSFLVAYGLILQIDLFYLLWDVSFSWYLPNLRMGFKYYLDLFQLVAVGLMALFLPLLSLGARWVGRRVLPGG
jgi:hypothetical protein